MSFFDPQNPGIGGFDALTAAEEAFLTTFAGSATVGAAGTILRSNGTTWVASTLKYTDTDPNADRILFWDDSAGTFTHLTVGSGLSISDTTLSATGSGSGIVRAIVTTSGSVTLGADAGTDYVYFVAGAHALTLPTAVSNTNRYSIKNNHSAAITVDTTSAQTIDGAASIDIAPEDAVDLVSNNSNWFVI